MATRNIKQRTRPRVEDSGSSGHGTKAQTALHRGTATMIENGELEITFQLSELVPVAQYANVTIGPVTLRWKTANPGLEQLGDVDWDSISDGDSLTAEQQKVYDTVRGYLRATSKLIEDHIAEDREAVEESVRLHNQREAEEEERAKKGNSSRRRSR